MPDPPILVGLRLGEPYRDRNWGFSKRYWEETLGWTVVEGHYDDPGPFSLARASNRAAVLAGDWQVALYVGADFFLDDPDQARQAVHLAAATGKLTLAHNRLVQLEEDETERLVEAQQHVASTRLVPARAGGPLDPRGHRHPDTFSGVLAIPRSQWDAVGGFDERFVGWGGDDISFWAACNALGGYDRIPGTMYHLWHPRSRADNEESPEYPANDELMRRYLAAKGNRTAMLAILNEPERKS